MFAHLLEHYPWICLGGLNPGPKAQQLLHSFWRTYRVEHPSHLLFQDADVDYRYVIPLIIHGDAGRSLKNQPIECISVQPVLGLDTAMDPFVCTCCAQEKHSARDCNDPMAQRLNSKNHSYLTHFCAAAFPSKKYQSTPGLLLSILHCISEDLRQLCTDGVKRPEGTYKFALLGFKGDLEYVAKCGMLSRSYQNVGHVNQIACCSDCKAGLPQYPFEDFTARAQWKRTVHIEVPWTAIPPFAPIAFEPWNSGKASMWFRGDPFHIFRLGIARNFIGSTIVMLAHEGHFDDTTDASESRALKARLERGWASFALWCHTHRETPAGLRSFSIQKLHMPTQGSFPYIGCKGSDTILLLRWLQWFTGLALISHPADNTLTLMLRGCQGGLSFQKIHNHGLWLRRQCRFNIHRSIKTFLSAYGHLARIAQNKRYTLYSMVPKAHALDHIADFIQRSNGNEYVLNPCTFDCSMAEDYIGRLARQSRRVSAKNCVSNTLLAYKVKARMQILRHKRARNL